MIRCPHCRQPVLKGLELIAFNLAMKHHDTGGVTNRLLVSMTKCSMKVASQALGILYKAGALTREQEGVEYKYRVAKSTISQEPSSTQTSKSN